MEKFVNERVIVTTIGFRKNLSPYPRSMEFRGSIFNFIDAGIRLEIRQGSFLTEILTLSDGIKNYSLRTDNRGGDWTLVSVW